MGNLGNVFILGDSYSTYKGYIPIPEAAFYRNEDCPIPEFSDVSQSWWYQVLERENGKLVLNDSYSGSTFCNTGYEGRDCREKSFVGRFDKLIAANYFADKKIDTLLLFGGTNDSWANSPIGELKWADRTDDDLYSVLPALCYLADKITATLPNTKVYCILNCELKEKINYGIREVCKRHGFELIELSDIEKVDGHPNIKGMRQIADQIVSYIG